MNPVYQSNGPNQAANINMPHLPASGSVKVNVPYTERMVSLTAGSLIFYSGVVNLFRTPLSSILKLAAGGMLLYRGSTGNCPMYSMLNSEMEVEQIPPLRIATHLTVNRPVKEVYDFWRRLENLPRFMSHLKEVIEIDAKRSHWVANLPGYIGSVKWNAEIVEEHPEKMISWCSIEGSTIDTAGVVQFTDNGDKTHLHVILSYRPPAGKLGETIAKWANSSVESMVRNDVMNFKNYIETSAPNERMRNENISM